MNLRTLCLLATLATAVLSGSASAAAFATAGAARPSVAPPRITGLVVKDKAASKRDRQPAAQASKAGHDGSARSSSHAATRLGERRQLLRSIAMEDRAHQHEQAQVEARAQRIYATSQVSAPILRDTSACKRIGAHGESIYENCALTAANVRSR